MQRLRLFSSDYSSRQNTFRITSFWTALIIIRHGLRITLVHVGRFGFVFESGFIKTILLRISGIQLASVSITPEHLHGWGQTAGRHHG